MLLKKDLSSLSTKFKVEFSSTNSDQTDPEPEPRFTNFDWISCEFSKKWILARDFHEVQIWQIQRQSTDALPDWNTYFFVPTFNFFLNLFYPKTPNSLEGFTYLRSRFARNGFHTQNCSPFTQKSVSLFVKRNSEGPYRKKFEKQLKGFCR